MTPSLRAAVIAEWRRLPERKMQPDRWQPPGELLPKLMQRLGLRERLRDTEVIDAWSKIVGDFIAAHSTPVALREGILYVRVLQPALHYELEQISKSEIPAQTKTTLRHQNHPRHPLPRRLIMNTKRTRVLAPTTPPVFQKQAEEFCTFRELRRVGFA